MKFLTIIIGILLLGFLSSELIAGQVYTWTDENGNLHVTDTPPPANSKVKDVLEYREKTAAELQELQNREQRRDAKREQESKIRGVEEAKRRARHADKAAQLAVEEANRITQEVETYVRRLGSTKEKRKQFRKRIQRELARAETARERARQAIEEARQAEEEARMAEEELKTQQE